MRAHTVPVSLATVSMRSSHCGVCTLLPVACALALVYGAQVQERVANSSKIGEQLGCVSLIIETLKIAHGLIDVSERKMEVAMREAEAKSEALRRQWRGRV